MFKPIYHQEKWLEEEEDLDAEKPKKGYATKTVGKHFDELTKILNSAILDGDKRTAFAVLSVLFKVFKRPSLSLIHAGLETLWNRKEISLFLRSIIDLSLNDVTRVIIQHHKKTHCPQLLLVTHGHLCFFLL